MITLQRRGIVDTYNGYSFSRPSMAFDSRGRMALPGHARFESIAGRRGVRVEESTTNLLNGDASSFENSNSNGWLFTLGDRADPTFPSGQGFHGNVGVLIPPATNGDLRFAVAPSLNVTAGQVLTISGHVKVVSGSADPSLFGVGWYSGGTTATISVSNLERKFIRDGWWRISATYTITGSGVLRAAFFVDNPQAANDSQVLFDAAQVEAKQYPTSWQLGGSTRSSEILTIPTAGVLGPGDGFAWDQGTVEMWAYVLQEEMVGGSRPRTFLLFRAGGLTSTAGFFDFYHRPNQSLPEFFVRLSRDPGGTVQFGWNPASPLPTGWHYFALTWDRNSSAKFYVDGVLRAQASIAGKALPINPNAAVAGDGPGGWLNNLVGPLRSSSRARTDQEIADAYAGGYLAWDADTTLLLPFDGPDAQRAAKAVVI